MRSTIQPSRGNCERQPRHDHCRHTDDTPLYIGNRAAGVPGSQSHVRLDPGNERAPATPGPLFRHSKAKRDRPHRLEHADAHGVLHAQRMTDREHERAGPQRVRVAARRRRYASLGRVEQRDVAVHVSTHHGTLDGAPIGRQHNGFARRDDVRARDEQVALPPGKAGAVASTTCDHAGAKPRCRVAEKQSTRHGYRRPRPRGRSPITTSILRCFPARTTSRLTFFPTESPLSTSSS